jgi:hypothetical protein
VNVPISMAELTPVSCVSRVMKVPCSGAICRPDSFGNRSVVSFASSLSTASGGLLCAVR